MYVVVASPVRAPLGSAAPLFGPARLQEGPSRAHVGGVAAGVQLLEANATECVRCDASDGLRCISLPPVALLADEQTHGRALVIPVDGSELDVPDMAAIDQEDAEQQVHAPCIAGFDVVPQ